MHKWIVVQISLYIHSAQSGPCFYLFSEGTVKQTEVKKKLSSLAEMKTKIYQMCPTRTVAEFVEHLLCDWEVVGLIHSPVIPKAFKNDMLLFRLALSTKKVGLELVCIM